MKPQILRLGTAVIIMMVALMANLTYIQVVKAVDYRHDANNRRTVLEEYSRARGQITAYGGVILARSTPVDDPYRYQRSYPGGAMYANLTGYYSLAYGPRGLERLQNDLLSGNDENLWVDQLSDLITGRDPQGGNVQLTVVPAIQQAAYRGLADRDYVGAVVAIRPDTGAILAMASTPSYDPDPLASHDEKEQRIAYNELVDSSPARDLDRAIGAVYPPGSTFKLVVAASALENGFTPESEVTGAATITLPDTGGASLSNYNDQTCTGGGQTTTTLAQALAHSCNTAFAEVALSVGAPALADTAAAFGIDGESFSVDGFHVAGSRLGDMGDPGALAQSGIGQRDVALTPLQNAIVAATIANGGQRMEPRLIAQTTRPDLSVISTASATVADQAISAEHAAQLRDMMVASEARTSGSGNFTDLHIASKTGTAEHGSDPKATPPHGWYVAFAPADDPQIAVAVLVTNGGGHGLDATGASIAAPIGRAVIAAAQAQGR